MTPRLTSQPSLGKETAGVRFTDTHRPYVSPSASYARTGWENAPIEPMDEPEPCWVRYARLTATGLGSILFIVLLGMVAINAAYPS